VVGRPVPACSTLVSNPGKYIQIEQEIANKWPDCGIRLPAALLANGPLSDAMLAN
jgi:hypothetical protein